MTDTIIIKGNYFDSQSSKARPAHLSVRNANRLEARVILAAAEELETQIVTISDRLGNIDRRIELADGHVFITPDNDGVDRLNGLRRGWFSQVSKIESFHPRLLVFLIAIVLLVFASIRWGLPLAARVAVWATPAEVVRWIDSGSLATVDRLFVEESKLAAAKKDAIRQGFAALVRADTQGDDPQTFNLLFRSGGILGPNAFALPAGTIVVTDSLAKLLSQDEMMAVLAHEIAHVHHAHGLQQFYRALGFAGLISVITGDLGAVSEEVLTGGGVLVAMAASREMELIADREAVQLLRLAKIDPRNLSTGLDKLYEAVCKEQVEKCEETGWFSSHPGGEERRQALEVEIQNK